MDNRIPVTLLTGFLGSGKTTLPNKLLAHPQMKDSAAIINELGSCFRKSNQNINVGRCFMVSAF